MHTHRTAHWRHCTHHCATAAPRYSVHARYGLQIQADLQHAATFEQDAYQRIGIALQRGIISDQLARAHARRTLAEHGALPSGCDSPLYEGLSA